MKKEMVGYLYKKGLTPAVFSSPSRWWPLAHPGRRLGVSSDTAEDSNKFHSSSSHYLKNAVARFLKMFHFLSCNWQEISGFCSGETDPRKRPRGNDWEILSRKWPCHYLTTREQIFYINNPMYLPRIFNKLLAPQSELCTNNQGSPDIEAPPLGEKQL